MCAKVVLTCHVSQHVADHHNSYKRRLKTVVSCMSFGTDASVTHRLFERVIHLGYRYRERDASLDSRLLDYHSNQRAVAIKKRPSGVTSVDGNF